MIKKKAPKNRFGSIFGVSPTECAALRGGFRRGEETHHDLNFNFIILLFSFVICLQRNVLIVQHAQLTLRVGGGFKRSAHSAGLIFISI